MPQFAPHRAEANAYKTRMWVAAASTYRVPKSKAISGTFGSHSNTPIVVFWQASYDFLLLVFYNDPLKS